MKVTRARFRATQANLVVFAGSISTKQLGFKHYLQQPSFLKLGFTPKHC